jgi:OOP family OmpA-OmpF porin
LSLLIAPYRAQFEDAFVFEVLTIFVHDTQSGGLMRRWMLSSVAVAALLAAAGAQAQVYLGGNVGWGRFDVDCSDLDSCDRTNTGYKAYGGYRFENNFAVEAVYFDWGKVTAQGSLDTGNTLPASLRSSPMSTSITTLSGDLKATGFGLGVAYFLPFAKDFSGVARLGAVQNRGKLSISDSVMSASSSKNSVQAYFGLGVGYNVTPNLAITAEADFSRVKWGAEGEYESDNVQLYTFGLRYSF